MQELMPELMSECLPQSMSGNYLRRFTRSDVRGYVKIPRMYVKIYVYEFQPAREAVPQLRRKNMFSLC